MSIVYIWLIFIALILGLSLSTYICNELYTNMDIYINVYNSLNK